MFEYHIMQMADGGLPTGGFAFSQGLEAAAVLGVATEDSLESYLVGLLEQAAGFELPYLNDFYRGADILEEYDATFLTEAQYKASLSQGRALARLWNWEAPEPPHYLALLGIGLAQEEWTLESVQRLYLHTLLRDQLSAAVRLSLTGPIHANRMQKNLYRAAERVRLLYLHSTHEEAARCSPVLDIAQGAHSRLYTKLFQN